jgi:aldose 1-epimerase
MDAWRRPRLSHVKVGEGYLVLQQGGARLTLDPLRGGSIREFNWEGVPIFRPTQPDAGDDPLEVACFPMIPFANRIAQGRFLFGGRTVRLSRNRRDEPHPLHGYGWLSRWSVVGGSASSATIRFEGGADEWPWRYRCEQNLQLQREGLSMELSIQNLSVTPMPAILGLHPYYPGAATATLEAHLPQVWLTDEASLPVEATATPPNWSFERPRAVNAVPLDNCFSGWNGIATLRWPDRTVTVRATGCNCLQIYAPAGKDFFCVEPQSAACGALGRNAEELTVIAPGERATIRVQFSVGMT